MSEIRRISGELVASDENKSVRVLAEENRANLRGAYLRGADLQGADLGGAYLGGANLRGADLWGADLWGADLGGANLRGANLRGADLQGADLGGANLWGADLGGANLRGANLRGANLQGADLQGAKAITALIAARLCITPTEGAFIGWKACRHGRIMKLEIPADARRSNATGRKCRAEFVRVLETIGTDCGIGIHDSQVVYRAGETVRCDEWCEDRWQECAGGIHFFLTREEAEQYAKENA